MRRTQLGTLILLLLVLIACSGTDGTATGDDDPIVIGASLPLTGMFSEPGTAVQQGYEVWTDMVNEAGGLLGRPVELTILDNASDQDTAVADYERLITVDEVELVVGPFSSLLVIPTSEVAARYGYAFVEPAGGSPEVFDRGLTNLFFTQPAPGENQADPFIEYVLSLPDDQRPQTFATVSLDDPFALGAINRAQQLLQDGGLEMVLSEVYAADVTDLSPIGLQLVDLDPDLIMGGTGFQDAITQIRAYIDAGYQPRGAFFTTAPSLPVPFKEALGDSTEGIFAAISWFAGADSHQNTEFVERYVDAFGGETTEIPEDAATAFSTGQVLGQAVEAIGSVDNTSLIEELQTGSFDTVVGPLSFDETGKPEGSYMILQWQGDQYVITAPDERAVDEPMWPKPDW